jgi:serine/threonine protein kinase
MFRKDSKEFEKINVGSPYYMPLEVLTSNQYSFQSDIWALGIIYYQMLVGKVPWKAKS